MKIISALLVSFICVQLFACSKNNESEPLNNDDTNTINESKMRITIGDKVFYVTLSDNPTASAFKALLPMTLTLSELNNNEKVYHLNTTLPTNSSPGGTIQVGDFMLYGNNALVLFYESFNTSYTYTRLGKVDDISGYKVALGSGNVTVKFELQ
ncbi:cyclophilin-like fold protein [Flavobacterium sp. 5]|uniref:cyclophilin-like fold protein n=1 Tax=Flavobacterium sp. 5 TaxID=2035199 RepID=UPI000C2B75F1|nr:cyclophilin-like fold protein [Flavobacterium sp. 5]PKB14970.1 hypothetical protein CLU82_0015 [Flavobacterium sp. 5]